MNLKKSCIINGLNDQGRRVKLEFKKNLYDQTAKSETNQPRFFFSSAFSMIANTMIVYQHTSAQSTLGSTNFALSRSCTYIHKRTRCALCTDGRHSSPSFRYFPGIFPVFFRLTNRLTGPQKPPVFVVKIRPTTHACQVSKHRG